MKRFKYINTLDIDHYHPAYNNINHILQKIKRLDCCVALMYRLSSSLNGYHIKIYCKHFNCDKCRLVFDDQIRFTADLTNREWYERNVLFNVKSYCKAGKTIVLTPTRWVIVKQFPRVNRVKRETDAELTVKILSKLNKQLIPTIIFLLVFTLTVKTMSELVSFLLTVLFTIWWLK